MNHRSVAAAAALVVALTGCTKNEITGRRKVNAVPDAVMNNLGRSGYEEVLAQSNVQRQGPDATLLNTIGERIARAANEPGFDWSYALIDDPTVNAWCMPGGYIGFYTGILPFLRTEAGMAFVMGHEVGHATSRHSAERMTQQLGVTGALTVVQAFLSGADKVSPEQKNMIFGAIGLGAEVGVLLPFSRKHESEADLIGLMYMADAGYPPGQAVGVWERMGAGGERPPEFLSTHPSPDTRIRKINEWLPQARKRYRRNQRAGEQPTAVRWQ